MVDTIYIEEEIKSHPRTLSLLGRFKNAHIEYCERYGQIFNRRNQNFAHQKKRPALILAKKHGELVYPTPADFGIGGAHNYYFSHMLNCIYDCRYCFLQGMFQSAHYVIFVNFEDFIDEISNVSMKHKRENPDDHVFFFSGYDCDSLGMESMTHFMSDTLESWRKLTNAWLEIRTKSINTRVLEKTDPLDRCVVAFSLTPAAINERWENGVPPLASRIEKMKTLQQQGWLIGLRFDPIIYHAEAKQHYQSLIDTVLNQLDVNRVHSVSVGPLRMPKAFLKKMANMHPTEALFANPKHIDSHAKQSQLTHLVRTMVEERLPKSKLFRCA